MTGSTATSVSLSWTASTSSPDCYVVTTSTTTIADASAVGTGDCPSTGKITGTSTTVSGLAELTTYYFRVQAVKTTGASGNRGTSTMSNQVSTTTPIGNNAPVAGTDSGVVNEDDPLGVVINVLANDTDIETPASLTVGLGAPATGPSHGTVSLVPGGIKYTPTTLNYFGPDSFTYRLCDLGVGSFAGKCVLGTVNVTVRPVNDAPMATDDVATTDEDADVSINLTANDTVGGGETGQQLGVSSIVTGPSNGFVAVTSPSTVNYHPNADFFGSDSFQYLVCDDGTSYTGPDPKCTLAWVYVTVNPVNDPVTVNPDAVTVAEGVTTTLALTTNDVLGPANESSQQWTITSPIYGAIHGNVIVLVNGSVQYVPTSSDYNGFDTFSYEACDNGVPTSCGTALVSVTITEVNDPPATENDTATMAEEGTTTIDVLGNDSVGPANETGQQLHVGELAGVDAGAVAEVVDGQVSYTGATDFVGTDTFTYQACDDGTTNAQPAGLCTTGTVTVTMTEVNDAPAVPTITTNVVEDESVEIDLTSTATPGPASEVAQTLSATVTTDPQHGRYEDGTYTPDADYFGEDTISTLVCDSEHACTVGLVEITVTPVNDAPVAVDDEVDASEDAAAVYTTLTENDEQTGGLLEAGETLAIASVSDAVNGTVELTGANEVTFTPDSEFHGSGAFSYELCDDHAPAACDTATVTVTIASVNDTPTAADESATVDEDSSDNLIDVLANDVAGPADEADDPLAARITDGPAHGTADVVDGQISYTPAPDFHGTDSITYDACDELDACDDAILSITVTNTNDAPIAADDDATTQEDVAVVVDVLANDSAGPDEANDLAVTAADVTSANGSVAVTEDDTITFTPAPDEHGTATFSYTVCEVDAPTFCDTAAATVTISPVNDAVVAADDDAEVVEDTPTPIDVLANDDRGAVNEAGQNLVVSSVSNETNGVATIAHDGSGVTFAPAADWNGAAGFTYEVCDDGTPVTCDTAAVTLTVSAVDDAPNAIDDAVSVNEGESVTIDLLGNDTPGGGPDEADQVFHLTATTQGARGTVVTNEDESVTYTATGDLNGPDSFTYTICDEGPANACAVATVDVDVVRVNDAPTINDDELEVAEDGGAAVVAALDNDVAGPAEEPDVQTLRVTEATDGAKGTTSVDVNGVLHYTPAANEHGADSFTYTACDDGHDGETEAPLCGSATVAVVITPVNDAPVLQPDVLSIEEDAAATALDVLANDTTGPLDAGQALHVSGITALPTKGAVTFTAAGVSYTPALNQNGTDSFTYEACDDGAPVLCSTAVVTVEIDRVNDLPLASDDALALNEDTTSTLEVTLNDEAGPLDEADEPVAVVAVGSAEHGTTSFEGDVIGYEPDADYNGTDEFTYTIEDEHGLEATATVVVTVREVNDPVTVSPVTTSTLEDTAVQLTVPTVSGPENESAQTVLVTEIVATTNGSADISNVGGAAGVLFTPTHDVNGEATVTYEACDDGTTAGTPAPSCAQATATITVTAVNDPAVAAADAALVGEDSSVLVDVLGNDGPGGGTDELGQLLSIASHGEGVEGDVELEDTVDGQRLRYTPAADDNGDDSFTYQVCDELDGCSVGVVSVTVREANDPPIAGVDAVTVVEDGPAVVVDALANDAAGPSNETTQTLRIDSANDGDKGTTSVTDGVLRYTPSADRDGADSFTYQLCDDGTTAGDADELCVTGTVNVTILDENDTPNVRADSAPAVEDTPTQLDVLANDDGGPFEGDQTVTLEDITVDAEHGTATVNGDTVTYVPDADFNGTDTFTYASCDDGVPSECATAVVTVDVSEVNDAPVAGDDVLEVTEDDPATVVDVLDNDTAGAVNEAAQTLRVDSVTQGTKGTTTLVAGVVRYVPTANVSGTDSFTYEVCDDGTTAGAEAAKCASATVNVTILDVNDDPTIAADEIAIAEDTTMDATVLANDTAGPLEAHQHLSISDVTQAPEHGTTTIVGTTVRYVPDADYFGSDSFTYEACDDGEPTACGTAVVSITMTEVNDAPVANADAASGLEDAGDITVDVLANDARGPGNENAQSLMLTDASIGAGLGEVDISSGELVYSPAEHLNGSVTIAYTASDDGTTDGAADARSASGTLTVTLAEVNDGVLLGADSVSLQEDSDATLVDVLANDAAGPANEGGQTLTIDSVGTDADTHGTVTIAPDGTGVTFQPDTDYVGAASFTYHACDDGTTDGEAFVACDTATVSVTVTPGNDEPVTAPDATTVAEDGTVVVDALANDAPGGGADETGQQLSIGTIGAAANGTVTQVAGAQTLRYAPTANFHGTDSFTYTACDDDPDQKCTQSTVSVTVTPVNDAPTASAGSFAGTEGAPIAVDLASLVSDLETADSALTYVVEGQPSNGALSGDGATRTYLPAADFDGTDSFTFHVADSGDPAGCSGPAATCAGPLTSSTVTVTLVVAPAPPQTFITGGAPSGAALASAAQITFRANKPSATFECSVDGAPFTACTSPASVPALAPGDHTFQVRAKDAAGTVDPTPASASWTVLAPPDAVDRTKPVVSFVGALPATSAALRAGLRTTIKVNERAKVVVQLTISPKDARLLLGMRTTKPVVIGTAQVLGTGTLKLVVKLNPKGRKALAKRGKRALAVLVGVTATDAAGNARSISRKLTIRK